MLLLTNLQYEYKSWSLQRFSQSSLDKCWLLFRFLILFQSPRWHNLIKVIMLSNVKNMKNIFRPFVHSRKNYLLGHYSIDLYFDSLYTNLILDNIIFHISKEKRFYIFVNSVRVLFFSPPFPNLKVKTLFLMGMVLFSLFHIYWPTYIIVKWNIENFNKTDNLILPVHANYSAD